MKTGLRRKARQRRHTRIRKKVNGISLRPRLSVFRSHKHIYAQIINDEMGCTLASASTLDLEFKEMDKQNSKVEAAQGVGALLAGRALEKGISQVIFDRGGYKYRGRVKALAEMARQAGLKI